MLKVVVSQRCWFWGFESSCLGNVGSLKTGNSILRVFDCRIMHMMQYLLPNPPPHKKTILNQGYFAAVLHRLCQPSERFARDSTVERGFVFLTPFLRVPTVVFRVQGFEGFGSFRGLGFTWGSTNLPFYGF